MRVCGGRLHPGIGGLNGICCDCVSCFELKGLEFIQEEIACLVIDELKNGLFAIGKLLDVISDGIPDFPPDADSAKNLPEYQDIPKEVFRKALQESKPSFKFRAHDNVESYEGLIDFFSFLESLEAAMKLSLENEKYLLIVQPQP